MKSKEFVAENYIKEELIFKREILFAFFVLTIAGLLFGIPFYLLWSENIQAASGTEVDIQTRIIIGVVVIGVLILGNIVHELIHGAFYAIFCKNKFKSIKYGAVLKKGYAYCECKEILQTKHFIVGLLMPVILLGILPATISIFIGNSDLLLFGVIFIGAGGSDILTFIKIAKNINNSWFENQASIPKFYIYSSIPPHAAAQIFYESGSTPLVEMLNLSETAVYYRARIAKWR